LAVSDTRLVEPAFAPFVPAKTACRFSGRSAALLAVHGSRLEIPS
jgi:hypothetical protein